jgi:serine/threonine-protein kinase
MGTPRYMSPEQCRGKNVDHRADIYALGVLTHEVLTGHAPFEGGTPVELLLQHSCEPPPRMSSVHAELPPELDAPVLAMLAKKPADRPPSAGAAVAALAAQESAAAAVITLPLGTIRMEAPEAARSAPSAATVLESPRKEPQPAPALERTQVSAGAAPAATTTSPTSVSEADLPGTGGAAYLVAGIVAAALLGAMAFGALHGRPEGPAAPAAAPLTASPTPPASVAAPAEPATPSAAVTPTAAPSSQPTAASRPSAAAPSRPPATPRSSERDLGF